MDRSLVETVIQSQLPKLVHLRRQLHQYPELSHQETKTTALVESFLKELGINRIKRSPGTGLWVDIGAGQKATLALRTVLDGIPIQEENTCAYRSRQPGIMHACGHDGHVAILLGACAALKAIEGELQGTVRLVFEPAEDTGTGAIEMIEAGVLGDPDVAEIYSFHLWPSLRQQQIGSRPGAIMAGNSQLRIQIRGRGGHSALPHQSVDAVVVAAQVILALQTVVSRQADPLQPVVLSIGTLQAGTSPFAVAETVEMMGTLRTFDPAICQQTLAQIQRIVHQVTAAFGAEGFLEVSPGSSPTLNTPSCVERVRRSVHFSGLGEYINLDAPAMIAEDFSRYLQHVPGAFIFAGVDRPGGGPSQPLHSPHFDFDEQAFAAVIWSLLGIVADFYGLEAGLIRTP